MSSDSSDTSKVEGGDGGSGTEQPARRGLEEEFNVQRARMKELFLQKEDNLRLLVSEKEQLQSEVLGLRAELEQLQTLSHNQKSDILSLQLLVNETVEASAAGAEDARKLRLRCSELEHQLAQLRREQGAEEGELVRYEAELAALKNKLRDTDSQLQEALKGKPTNVTTSCSSGDTRPDPEGARSCDMCDNYEKQLVLEQREAAAARERRDMLEQALKLATEELEGARSIHEETIRSWRAERAASTSALDELREAVDTARSTLADTAAAAQQASQRALQHVTTLTVEREELQRRLDSLECDNAMLVGRFTKKAEEMQNEFIDLPDNVEELQLTLLELREKLICVQIGREEALAAERGLRAQLLEHGAAAAQADAALAQARAQHQQAREELERLAAEREQLQELGGKLRQSNDTISSLLEDKVRRHTLTDAEELERLAAEREQLQQLGGKLRQSNDTISSLLEDKVRRHTLTDAEELERLAAEREQLQQLGGKLRQSNDTISSLLEDKVRRHTLTDAEELERLAAEREQLQQLGGKLRQSNDTISSLLEDKKRILGELAELRARVSALQQELDNSEKVQQDFVRLSQSLQVQLQRIREADTEVRWQHDEDVTSCPSCHVALPNNKKKVHCRHCGRIFCAACAAHSVASGPRRAPARVCAVCRTLLQPHTAPYFSTAPPHTPD